MNAPDRPPGPDPAIRPLIEALHEAGRPRVWSIVITIFGDALPHRGWRVAMSDLQALIGPLGVGGGALRTAMSRLASEGWVARDKAGRNSFYELSAEGQRQFTEASARIYATNPVEKQGWALSIEAAAPDEPVETARLARNVRLVPADEIGAEWAARRLVVQGRAASVPDWARETLLPVEASVKLAELAVLLDALLDHGPALRALPPRDAMIARVLIVHFWRRLLLRHPFLPADFVPDDWPGFAAHDMVRRCYEALIEPSERWWPDRTPRRTISQIRQRFGIDPYVTKIP